jgi:hypothetical protein
MYGAGSGFAAGDVSVIAVVSWTEITVLAGSGEVGVNVHCSRASP